MSDLDLQKSGTKIITIIATILVTLVVLLKSDLDVQQPHIWGGFVERKLVLSFSFRCDQIQERNCYEYGHTLLCYLRQTWMFNNPIWSRFVGQKLVLSFSLRCEQSRDRNSYEYGHTLLGCLSWTWITSEVGLLKNSSCLVSSSLRCDQIQYSNSY